MEMKLCYQLVGRSSAPHGPPALKPQKANIISQDFKSVKRGQRLNLPVGNAKTRPICFVKLIR